MKAPVFCLLFVIHLCLAITNEITSNSNNGGFIGCLYSDVCRIDEVCIDDHLFGSCKRTKSSFTHSYEVDRNFSEIMATLLSKLVSAGFSWSDLYTQCVVRSALLSIRLKSPTDLNQCGSGPDSNEIILSEPKKRDEIIKVHKYFFPNNEAENGDEDSMATKKRDGRNEEVSRPIEDMDDLIRWLQDGTPRAYGDDNAGDLEAEYRRKLAKEEEMKELKDMEEAAEYRRKLEKKEEVNEMEKEAEYSRKLAKEEAVEDLKELEEEAEYRKALEMVKEVDEMNQMEEESAYRRKLARAIEQELQEEIARALKNDNIRNVLNEPEQARKENQGKKKEREQTESDLLSALHSLVKEGYLRDNGDKDPQQRFLQEKKSFLKKWQHRKKTTPPPNTEAANPKSLVKNTGYAKSKTTTKTEDPEVALKQLHLTKREYQKPGANDVIDKTWVWVKLKNHRFTDAEANRFLETLSTKLGTPLTSFNLANNGSKMYIHVPSSGSTSDKLLEKLGNNSKLVPGYEVEAVGYGTKTRVAKETLLANDQHFLITFVVCGAVLAGIIVVIIVFCLRKANYHHDKLYDITKGAVPSDSSESYKELCRQRMQSKSSDRPENIPAAKMGGRGIDTVTSPNSTRSSTSSCRNPVHVVRLVDVRSEEPVQSNMDISTGHVVLSYMEDHLNNKDKLEAEWATMCAYEADNIKAEEAKRDANKPKNRYVDVLPYDHARVPLKKPVPHGTDYINASFVVDHDPKNPAFIATQGPLGNTIADFWQMVWEQGSVVIVNLTRLIEAGVPMSHKYWPEEGSQLYNNYEVHLVSEHVWCEDYLVRSFYLKNVSTGETRTVTQFHFLSWSDLGVPATAKSVLDFRRKVNKSFRGRQSPVIVHCSDGCGRTGTYILMDMVLNRLAKGVKEIDISATLEHLRDQRCDVVKTKAQYEFVLTAIAEEVHAMLKVLPQ